MSAPKSYKQLHEEFVVSTGTSAWECLLLVSPYPLLAFLSCYIVHIILRTNSGFLRFLVEFVVLVVPLILSLTLFHGLVNFLVPALLLSVIICLICNLWNRRKNFIRIVFTLVTPVKSRAYITYFRSIVNLISVFCILAVDFPVFPRQFAKTKSYGFSLMDTGVGFFIIANGIVARPNTNKGVMKTIKTTLPLFALGVFRCISIKSLGYQQVVTEYGTHWNFFFTLVAVKLMGAILVNIFPKREFLGCIVVAAIHHCILQSGLEFWLISETPRTNPFSANREGIASLPGYLSLFMAALAIGRFLQRDKVDLQKDLKQASKAFFASVILYVIMFWLHSKYPVSRRLANVTYIVWLISMTSFLLGICIIIEISLRVINFVKGITTLDNLTPTILNSINYNGLLFFLLGNIFTGIINIWMETHHVSLYTSLFILTGYMFLLCFFSNLFFRNHIKLSL